MGQLVTNNNYNNERAICCDAPRYKISARISGNYIFITIENPVGSNVLIRHARIGVLILPPQHKGYLYGVLPGGECAQVHANAVKLSAIHVRRSIPDVIMRLVMIVTDFTDFTDFRGPSSC